MAIIVAIIFTTSLHITTQNTHSNEIFNFYKTPTEDPLMCPPTGFYFSLLNGVGLINYRSRTSTVIQLVGPRANCLSSCSVNALRSHSFQPRGRETSGRQSDHCTSRPIMRVLIRCRVY